LNENVLSIVNQRIDEVMKKYSKDKEQFRNKKLTWIKKKYKTENINLSDVLESDSQNIDISLYLDSDSVFNNSTLSMPNLSFVSAVEGPMDIADISINTPPPSPVVTHTGSHNTEPILAEDSPVSHDSPDLNNSNLLDSNSETVESPDINLDTSHHESIGGSIVM